MSTNRWGERLVGYPGDLARRYRRAGLWGTRTIAGELHAVASAHPRREAVVALDGRLTYHELDERTDLLAAGLAGLGLRPGDPVLFQVTNRLGAVIAWYGVLKAGLVPVCTLAAHRGHEIGEISRRTGAVAHLVEAGTTGFDLVGFAAEQQRDHPTLRHILVLGGAGAPGIAVESLGAGRDPRAARATVEDIQRGIDPDDVAVFQLSGGTTGVPKVIPRLHAEYWYNAAAYARSWGWTPDTRVAHLIPVIHNAGIVCAVHGPHSAGACLVLGSPDLAVSLPLMAQEGATHVLLGHGHFKAVAEPGFAAAAASLTQVVLSGAKVPPALFGELERRGLWSGQLFGMGEGLFLTTRPGAAREARATTVGIPLSPLDEIRILEPGTDTELPDGQVGELCCRGPYTLRGYFDAAAHNARAFTPDGFYRTGDLACVREIGGQRYLSIEGRIKDVINRGGEKINAEEVELLLLRHPRIIDAAAVAMPDPRLGERTCAYLVVRGEPLSLAEIREHFAQLQVAKFKWPERVEHLTEIPRTLVGKTDKKRLTVETEIPALPARLPGAGRLLAAPRSTIAVMASSEPPGAARGTGRAAPPRPAKAGPAKAGPAKDAGKPAGATTARRELVENEIYEHAIRLFAERGFAGTSLQDIADALGITRPALYYYVKSKDELLAKLAADVAGGSAAQITELAGRPDLDAAGKLREIVRLTALRQANQAERFRLLIRSEAELPAELSDAYDTSRRAVLHAVTDVIDEGIRAGRFRPVDARIAALGVIGMWNWVAWWFRPERDSADAVADQLADMAIAALQRADHRIPDGEGPAAALKMLRQDIDHLERVLDL
jgi:non-ribosomal peptide synthetase component E (peptide arylation enzyme)/AcrR family transcriptional regulator